MSIVSISEAAELTGKTRRTIQRHVASGKLSRSVANGGRVGVDTSELMRVYGQLTSRDGDAPMSQPVISTIAHKNDINDKIDNERLLRLEHELSLVKVELEAEKKRVQDKQETIDTLKSALKLLEHKQTKDDLGNTDTIPDKEPEPPLNEVEDTINAKQETIDTLKSALKLLEHKQAKDDVHNVDTIQTKEPEPPLNEVEDTGNLGLLGRFKKLFR